MVKGGRKIASAFVVDESLAMSQVTVTFFLQPGIIAESRAKVATAIMWEVFVNEAQAEVQGYNISDNMSSARRGWLPVCRPHPTARSSLTLRTSWSSTGWGQLHLAPRPHCD